MNARPKESKPILKLTPKAANEVKKVCADDGFTAIPNELLFAMGQFGFTQRQYAVLIAVIQKTLSWHKEMDWISNEQIAELANLYDHKVASKVKNELVAMHVLVQQGRKIGLNLVISEWKKANSTKDTNIVQNVRNKSYKSHDSYRTNHTTTKETITKENINITPLPPIGASVEQGEETSSLAKPKSEPVDYEGVMEAWNEVFAETPIATIRVMSDERKRQVHRLAKNLRSQFGNYSVKAFRDYFADFWQQVASQTNSWYLGHNPRKWVADFDYLMKPKTFAKTVEESL